MRASEGTGYDGGDRGALTLRPDPRPLCLNPFVGDFERLDGDLVARRLQVGADPLHWEGADEIPAPDARARLVHQHDGDARVAAPAVLLERPRRDIELPVDQVAGGGDAALQRNVPVGGGFGELQGR